ncbi:MAG TPA: hypothetical protein VK186_10415 [Candidatus Deferrimicrobium sp.]|nr:hypothetical protein [Candidatus Kapabacteria bacterium]HLP59235.1 hypothetical protein [Candidatus Deferrimicrobium sp.]
MIDKNTSDPSHLFNIIFRIFQTQGQPLHIVSRVRDQDIFRFVL